MHRIFAKRFMACVLSLSLLGAGLPSIGYGSMISTQRLIETERSQEDPALNRVGKFVSQENVRDKMVELGADPVEVRERLAALTDEELRLLDKEIETLPAGGILAVIGIVFVVLLILELTGTIDIFKKV